MVLNQMHAVVESVEVMEVVPGRVMCKMMDIYPEFSENALVDTSSKCIRRKKK